MEETAILLERHEQRLKTVEREIRDLKEVQAEIRTMNEALVMLANELKHANEHLMRHEQKIEEMESRPTAQLRQIVTAAVAALAGGCASSLLAWLFR